MKFHFVDCQQRIANLYKGRDRNSFSVFALHFPIFQCRMKPRGLFRVFSRRTWEERGRGRLWFTGTSWLDVYLAWLMFFLGRATRSSWSGHENRPCFSKPTNNVACTLWITCRVIVICAIVKQILIVDSFPCMVSWWWYQAIMKNLLSIHFISQAFWSARWLLKGHANEDHLKKRKTHLKSVITISILWNKGC